jgi:hypothetical protein
MPDSLFGAFLSLVAVIANVETISSDLIPDTSKWWPIFWSQFWSLGSVATIYSSLWVAGFAFLRSARVQRVAPEST